MLSRSRPAAAAPGRRRSSHHAARAGRTRSSRSAGHRLLPHIHYLPRPILPVGSNILHHQTLAVRSAPSPSSIRFTGRGAATSLSVPTCTIRSALGNATCASPQKIKGCPTPSRRSPVPATKEPGRLRSPSHMV